MTREKLNGSTRGVLFGEEKGRPEHVLGDIHQIFVTVVDEYVGDFIGLYIAGQEDDDAVVYTTYVSLMDVAVMILDSYDCPVSDMSRPTIMALLELYANDIRRVHLFAYRPDELANS